MYCMSGPSLHRESTDSLIPYSWLFSRVQIFVKKAKVKVAKLSAVLIFANSYAWLVKERERRQQSEGWIGWV